MILLSVIYFRNSNDKKTNSNVSLINSDSGFLIYFFNFFVSPKVMITGSLTDSFVCIQSAYVIQFIIAQFIATFIFIVITKLKPKK